MNINQEDLLKRITRRPDVFGGKPIVRDLRISVEQVLSLLAQGESCESILDDYPGLDQADINACLAIDRYAGELTGGATLTVGTGNRSAPSGFRFDADITP